MKTDRIDVNNIPGWGKDADELNEPTYPYKTYTGDDHDRLNWERPTLQQSKVEVLKSPERPSLSAAYGTTVPPSGLSGMLRRLAFKYTENQYRHWLPLLLADRINVLEGIISDVRKGSAPNILAESGYPTLFKYKPLVAVGRLSMKILVYGVMARLLFMAFRRRA